MTCPQCDIEFDPIPTDPAEFKQYALNLQREMRQLKLELRRKIKERYEATRERFIATTKQVELFNEMECRCDYHEEFEEIARLGAEHGLDLPNPTKPKRKKKTKKDFSHLPVASTTEHVLAEKDRICGCCNEPMTEIGEEKTNRIEIIPAKAKRHVDIYKKYACKNNKCLDGQIKLAKSPLRAVPKIQATEETLGFIAAQKYQYALPLYRIEAMTAQMGCKITRNVMASWMIKAALALQPVYEALVAKLMKTDYIHIDETSLQVLKEKDRSPSNKSYVWARRTGNPKDPPIVVFNYTRMKNIGLTKKILQGFTGYVQSDGLNIYDFLKDEAAPEITSVGCIDHARRKFIKALKAFPEGKKHASISHAVLVLLRELYAIEREIKEYEPEQRHAVRQTESKYILERIKRLIADASDLSSSSNAEDAVGYMQNQWKTLCAYIDNPMLNISNAPAERAIRPFVIGRKNWLFADTPNGANGSMIFYSLIETAKANDLVPMEYIADTLKRIPYARTEQEIDALLPLKPPS